MKWLILRRLSQLAILALFLSGPLLGVWITRGSLAGSMTLDFLPMADPFTLLQTALAGHFPAGTAIIGALLVTLFYLLVGGRVFCSWVCPVNIITDVASWIRKKLDIKHTSTVGPGLRYWLLAIACTLAIFSGITAWETINPANVMARSLIFAMQDAIWMGLGLFIFALLIKGGWCRICPTGAFYSLLGFVSLTKVKASKRENCDNCNACYQVCPEPQVLIDPLKTTGSSPVIRSGQCTNCGRCIDVCSQDVFRFARRF